MLPLGWRLSAAQWAVLTETLQLDGYPAPIQVRRLGCTDVEAGAELRRLGLLRAGRVDADLEAALHLLHRPASWLDSVWFADAAAEHPVRVLVAQGGTVGVCALQHPDRPGATDLDFIPVAAVAAAAVSRLPPHPPGRRPTVSVALAPSSGRPAQSPAGVLIPASPARTSAERDSAAASAILDQPHTRAGQIAANAQDSAGQVRRSQILRWFDNPEGRYQVCLSNRSDASRSLTISPGDAPGLRDDVQRLFDAVQPS